MLKKILALSLFFLLTATTAGAAESLQIGVTLPLTGPNAFAGRLELGGILLAHREAGSVLGRKVRLIRVDNKSDTTEVVNSTALLAERDRVTGIVGFYSSNLAIVGGRVAESQGVPTIVPSATSPAVTLGKKYIFRACRDDLYQGALAAAWVRSKLGLSKAAILRHGTGEYQTGLADAFEKAFVQRGGRVMAHIGYQPNETDFREHLAKIIALAPDLLFIPEHYNEGSLILRQAREMGAEFRIMGGDAMDNPVLALSLGGAAEGFMHMLFAYDPTMPDMNPAAAAFTAAWRDAYPGEEPNSSAALGYTAYMMMIDAIRRADSDSREAVARALEKMMDLDSVFGPLSITEGHTASTPMSVIEIRDGKRHWLGEVTP
ncbi:MAG: ABC transporter substrate-binding protein [Desulfovibrio sp.]|jgi:branched-chain amino acid transport system substrate-binding protein|nr:ABC transporter substrate-binding protein [Desulfovibrio sp.]